MQGIALGALVQGIKIADRQYAGGWWDWLTPFSVLTRRRAWSSATRCSAPRWLNLKTIGAAADQGPAPRASIAGVGTLALIGAVSLWTPFLDPIYFTRWFQWPTAFFSAFVPLLLAVCAFGLWQGLTTDKHLQPFLSALGLFVLSFAGLGISFYPYIVPGALTIKEAAAPDASLGFLLVGALVLVPIILAYTGYAYWVFRGKVDPDEGYH